MIEKKTHDDAKRKPYAKPSLKVYGDVRDLTRASTTGRDRDVNQGGIHTRT